MNRAGTSKTTTCRPKSSGSFYRSHEAAAIRIAPGSPTIRFLLLTTISAASLCAQNNASSTRSEKLSGEFARGQDDPQRLLAEGDRIGWLKNWQKAEPFFARAEVLFREGGDRRNELYSRVSRIRGELQKRGLFETSTLLASILDDPLLKNDPQLRLRCLTVKGDVDLDFDTDLAARDWTEALSVAKSLGDSAWIVPMVNWESLTSFTATTEVGRSRSWAP